jgi:hypothetical protein
VDHSKFESVIQSTRGESNYADHVIRAISNNGLLDFNRIGRSLPLSPTPGALGGRI